MADITIYVSEERYQELLEKGFDTSVGSYVHNVAVQIMAYDTGNARSAISNRIDTPRHIQIHYNLLKANYIKFLDEGVGPVKKHKGIVSVLTVGAIAEELVGWIITGKRFPFTPIPVVALRQSKYRPFSAKSSVTGLSEKDVLRQANMNTNAISSQARSEVSKFREYTYLRLKGGIIKGSKGIQPETITLKGNNRLAINKNISILKTIVQDQKRKLKKQREEAQNAVILNHLTNR